MERFCYIAGDWTEDGELFDVMSPGDGSIAGMALRPSPAGIGRAVRAAAEAFSGLRRMPVYEKEEILLRVAGMIGAEADELTRLIVSESGKPVRYAAGEVSRAVRTFTEASHECSRAYGEVIPLDVTRAAAGRVGLTGWFPVGPVLAITPFNFPLNLVAHKLAPAIAAGCPVILKPSSETPLTALKLASLIDKAGLPKGGLSVLPMSGREAGELAQRREIRKVTFTGSAKVGWGLRAAAYGKRVTLELGGNAAVVLHDDWEDIDLAVQRIVMGGYAFSGQVCISVQRIFVQNRMLDRFLKLFIDKVESLRRGDPFDTDTDIGPMITETEAMRVEAWVDEAVNGGARILTGGKRDGAFFEPTVITGAAPGMKIVEEELFGPVTVVSGYDDFDSALERVNDSRFGLQAGIYTKDIDRIRGAFGKLETGGVIAGDVPTFRVDRMPYGGMKDSGTGREGLRYAIREMCEQRLLVIT